MKKHTLLVLVLFLYSTISFSQDKPSNTFWSKVQFGGGLTLNFTNNASSFGVSPSAIYNFNDKFSSGFGISYLRTKYRNITTPYNSYGGSIITLFNPLKSLQLSGEYEYTRVIYDSLSRDIPALFLGAGYQHGRNITIGLKYDVLYDENQSLYPSALNPFVRIYF